MLSYQQEESKDKYGRKIFAPGIYDIRNKEYHSSSGISRSAISEMQKSPLHYWDKYLNPSTIKDEPTPAMILGTAVHTLILEPNKFHDEISVFEKSTEHANSNAAKAHKSLFFESNSDKQIIPANGPNSYDLAMRMANAVLSHTKSLQILNEADVEKSIYWIDKDSGILCKSRPDIWNKELNLLGDIKTTRDSTPRNFSYTVKDGNYHMQAAMQIDGIYETTGKKVNDFIFIVVQNERPYKPYIYRLDDLIIESGRREYKEALKVFKKCFESDYWSKDRDTLLPIVFTDFMLNQSTFYQLSGVYECN